MTTAMVVQKKAVTLRDELFKNEKQFAMAMPKWMTTERLLRVVFTATMKNPKLLDCTKESLFGAIMQCAQLGLEPILGRAYLIPYNNNKHIDGKWQKVLECQFQPGYQGLIDLARRSNTISDVQARNVFENDDFDLSFELDTPFHHRPWFMDPNKRSEGPGELLGAYANWILKDGTKHFEFMYRDEIYQRRDRSQAYQHAVKNSTNKGAQDCPWIQWPDEMTVKTVIKHSSKLVPASIEFMEAAVNVDNESEMGLIPRLEDGALNLTSLSAGPSDRDKIDLLIESNDLDREKVGEFVDKLAERYKASREDILTQAFEDETGFIAEFNKWANGVTNGKGGSELTIQEELNTVKTPGLRKWEAKNHNDIQYMSPKDRKFFLDKWLRIIGHDYYAEGQPGYEPTGEGTDKGEDDGNGKNTGDDAGRTTALFLGRMIKLKGENPEIYDEAMAELAMPADIREIPPDMYDHVVSTIENKIEKAN